MWDKRDDLVVHEAEPFNAEPTRAALAAGHLTPNDTFYSRNHGRVPDLDPDTWRLVVDGLVHTPLELSLPDLRSRFDHHELVATLQCAGNRRAGLLEVRDIPGEAPWGPGTTSTAAWTGVRLADVLEAAGVDPAAGHVAFEAPDVAEEVSPPEPYAASIPVAKARAPEVLLAWEMNGEPLPPIHGAPVRVVVPGWIGARSVKWVTRVSVRTDPSTGFFQETAYRLLPVDGEPGPGVGVSLGPVALNSDVLRPDDGDTVPAGRLRVSGYAYAGEDRSVARVDVSTDGGTTWRQAELDPGATTWSWQLWHTDVELAPGPAEVVVRAWDSTAATQPASPADVWNPKGYVNNAWGRVRLEVS